MADEQGKLRDAIGKLCIDGIGTGRVSIVQAAVACMGACAMVIGLLPPESRAVLADEVTDNLLQHANRRGAEIRRGDHG